MRSRVVLPCEVDWTVSVDRNVPNLEILHFPRTPHFFPGSALGASVEWSSGGRCPGGSVALRNGH